MSRPIDAPLGAPLLTATARSLLEAELQELSLMAGDARRLGPCPTDPRVTVAGRITELEDVLRSAVILRTTLTGPGLVAVGVVVDLLAADGARLPVRIVAGLGGRRRAGVLDVGGASPLGSALMWQATGASVCVADAGGSAMSFTIGRLREPLSPPPPPGRWRELLRAVRRLRSAGWRRATMAGGDPAGQRSGHDPDRALLDPGRPRDGRRIRDPHHAAGAFEGRAVR